MKITLPCLFSKFSITNLIEIYAMPMHMCIKMHVFVCEHKCMVLCVCMHANACASMYAKHVFVCMLLFMCARMCV